MAYSEILRERVKLIVIIGHCDRVDAALGLYYFI